MGSGATVTAVTEKGGLYPPANKLDGRQSPADPNSFIDGFLSSRTFVSALLFAFICSLAATFHFGHSSPLQGPERTWASWAINDFLSAKETPQVVFLGSSLVLVPLSGVDANYLGKRLDGSQHHQSNYFEDQFKKATGKPLQTFNFALPGEMPSDAYLITDFLLERNKKPRVLVYGLGPRDFMDNILPSPSATDPFRSLVHFGEIGPMIDRLMPDWVDKLNFQIGRSVYLYGAKESLSWQCGQALEAWLGKVVPVPAGCQAYTAPERRLVLPAYKTSELNRGEAFFRPGEKEQFADNLNEYRKRYATVKWDTFTTQMRFFAELLDVAKQREIHVVIVSMPITGINRSLIANYAWDAYRQSVHLLATLKGALFVDLQGSGRFQITDFMDTVHLNSDGGKKMLDMLVRELAFDRSVRTALDTNDAGNGSAQARAVTGRTF